MRYLIPALATVLIAWQGLPVTGQDKNTPLPAVPFTLPETATAEDYLVNTVLFKVVPEEKVNCSEHAVNIKEINQVLAQVGAENLGKRFKGQLSSGKKSVNPNYVDLTTIYAFTYQADWPIEQVVNALINTGKVVYAQPQYIQKMLYTPNDPSVGSQTFLDIIQAYDAWDVVQGDTNIVIAITDMGTDMDHPDLVGNMKLNPNDPINGVDDDQDGYIDNYYGWDLGENDNNPEANHVHGPYVTGIAAATTDNGVGVAGTGFNTKFMHIKISDADLKVTKGFDAIVYAAEHGCQIINCSWGGTAYPGPVGQDVINYATYNWDAVVVASAGNTNGPGTEDQIFYPAAYANVLSVAATTDQDVRCSGSVRNHYVDVSAPGDNIYTTWWGSIYKGAGGCVTSYAAPVVAGMAGLVKAQFPSYSAQQIAEQIRVTSEFIDTIPGNEENIGKMGIGRVNLYRALTITNFPSIRVVTGYLPIQELQNKYRGDTASLAVVVANFLTASSNLSLTLSSPSPYIDMIDSTTDVGVINSLELMSNTGDPFVFKIADDVPVGAVILLRLDMQDGDYRDFQYFEIQVNAKGYANIDTNLVAATIASNGCIGYANGSTSYGTGIRYKGGNTLVSWSGLMVGQDTSFVADNVYGLAGKYDADFVSTISAKAIVPPVLADQEIQGVFEDTVQGISVEHISRAWNNQADENYFMTEYNITNTGASELAGLYAGLFIDWDIVNAQTNVALYDTTDHFAYVENFGGSVIGALRLLSDSNGTCYAMDLDGAGGSVKQSDGLTSAEKFTMLTVDRHAAGNDSDGNDVAHVVSQGPFTLAPGATQKVAFAIIMGDDLTTVREAAAAAWQKYQAYNATTRIREVNDTHGTTLHVFPNPVSGQASIQFSLPESGWVEIHVYNHVGARLHTITHQRFEQGRHTVLFDSSRLASGIYYIQFNTSKSQLLKRMATSNL